MIRVGYLRTVFFPCHNHEVIVDILYNVQTMTDFWGSKWQNSVIRLNFISQSFFLCLTLVLYIAS